MRALPAGHYNSSALLLTSGLWSLREHLRRYNSDMRITTKFSYEDLQDIPPDRNRYEIVDGELFVTAASIPVHQRIVMNLAAHLWQFLRAHRMGEVLITPLDVVFTSETVLEPDIIFVSQARLDREIKPKQYARYGVPEFFVAWILRERPSKFFG